MAQAELVRDADSVMSVDDSRRIRSSRRIRYPITPVTTLTRRIAKAGRNARTLVQANSVSSRLLRRTRIGSQDGWHRPNFIDSGFQQQRHLRLASIALQQMLFECLLEVFALRALQVSSHPVFVRAGLGRQVAQATQIGGSSRFARKDPSFLRSCSPRSCELPRLPGDGSLPNSRRCNPAELQTIETIFSSSRCPDLLEPVGSSAEPQSFEP